MNINIKIKLFIIIICITNSCTTYNKFNISKKYYPSVSQNERIKYIILHYTALNNDLSIKVLTKKNVSSHYLITNDTNNDIYILVDENKRSWHAGISKWKNDIDLNTLSIGIEIVNNGDKYNENFEDYTELQIDKIAYICKRIIKSYNIKPYNILGHSDISSNRKKDPGPKFPWKYLYLKYGIGAWYDENDKNIFIRNNPFNIKNCNENLIKEIKQELKKYGYNIETTDEILDTTTINTLKAFQMHFRPKKYDGIPDIESWAILKSLNKKYNYN